MLLYRHTLDRPPSLNVGPRLWAPAPTRCPATRRYRRGPPRAATPGRPAPQRPEPRQPEPLPPTPGHLPQTGDGRPSPVAPIAGERLSPLRDVAQGTVLSAAVLAAGAGVAAVGALAMGVPSCCVGRTLMAGSEELLRSEGVEMSMLLGLCTGLGQKMLQARPGPVAEAPPERADDDPAP